MFYNYYDDYQYDSCVSKGICSIGPRTSSLQEIFLMYLRQLSFYTLELINLGGVNNDVETVIFNALSTYMANIEAGDEQVRTSLNALKSMLDNSKKAYEDFCKEKGIEKKSIPSNISADENTNINELIEQGEKEHFKRAENMSSENKNLFDVLSLIAKSLCIDLCELKDYDGDKKLYKKGFCAILKLFNILNYPDSDIQTILDKIKYVSSVDYEITKELLSLKTERYGTPTQTEVSYSTRPNKAILVAGTNLRELEKVLEYTKDKNVDVYTHGEMILAHTYPKFREYPHLIGHFGIGAENCLLDFANFPGAILITKYATENIEYLYRGRLFTTDYFQPKGVVKIVNDNFKPLVDSAKGVKGFKRGKSKPSVVVGVDEKIFDNISDKISEFKRVIIIAPESFSYKNKKYFEHLLNLVPKDVFVISFSYNKNCNHIMGLNGVTDFSVIFSIIDKIKPKEISIFISKCDKHTISNLINLNQACLKNIFLAQCAPITLNPALMQILADYYNVVKITNPIDDLRRLTS